MQALPVFSQISLYVLLAIVGALALLIWGLQLKILRGRAFTNPDGSVDDWHEQRLIYGIAFADAFLACPVNVAGIILVFLSPRWGYYLLALVGFWALWANTMTTATSLRFHKPKITFCWFVAFPLGALVGLAYIVWTALNFDVIYFPS